jgi:hypothetical protein
MHIRVLNNPLKTGFLCIPGNGDFLKRLGRLTDFKEFRIHYAPAILQITSSLLAFTVERSCFI